MSEKLEVRVVRETPALVLLQISGTLDARGAMELESQAARVRESRRHLVLNLAAVRFMSSTGVGVLLAIGEELGDLGLSLRLSAPSEAVTSPIELLSLERFLTSYPGDDEACADLAA